MVGLHAEIGIAQLCKHKEELCGDKVEITRTTDSATLVLSDGLGSGVKANILATLTTKIASSMLKRGMPLGEVVNTVTATLPVCQQRKIAYSTLQMIKVANNGYTKVVEMDSPATFLLRDGKVMPFPVRNAIISGKRVKKGQMILKEHDVIMAVSDGVIHAGIGGLLKLGWNWQGVAQQLARDYRPDREASWLAQRIVDCCSGYYLDEPGDDSTVAILRIRRPRKLTIMTGPPAYPEMDEKVVARFMGGEGKKVVAGGTTANIVSRVTGHPLQVEMTYYDPKVPPIGHLAGVDLVTEGVLTLNMAIDRLHSNQLQDEKRRDGASLLARILADSDQVVIMAGRAVNPAHQNPAFPLEINIKAQVLEKLCQVLAGRGKEVTMEWV